MPLLTLWSPRKEEDIYFLPLHIQWKIRWSVNLGVLTKANKNITWAGCSSAFATVIQTKRSGKCFERSSRGGKTYLGSIERHELGEKPRRREQRIWFILVPLGTNSSVNGVAFFPIHCAAWRVNNKNYQIYDKRSDLNFRFPFSQQYLYCWLLLIFVWINLFA